MKEYWINKKNNKDLIVFFAGWGMDQNPFLPLKYNDLDILICYDYSDMNLNDLSIMDIIENGNYKNIYLIGFSMGVAVAGYLFQSELCIKFRQIIAINGTLEPISDENGIPVNIFENTLESWDSANKEHFLKRMCRDEIICSKYRINLPKRTLQDEKKELTNLHLFFKGKKDIIDCYDTAIVSCNDRIFPEKNQINFWEGRAKIIRCQNAPHFIFYNWESWEDLLKYASGN